MTTRRLTALLALVAALALTALAGPSSASAFRVGIQDDQAFVLAPAQCCVHSPERASHGRSLIVDPWGIVLAQLGDRPGVAVADCSLAELERVRASVPALRHRRL